MSLASLPMYDLPELREATDAWWAGLAEKFRAAGIAEVPDRLTRSDDISAAWHSPALLLSQTCGYPMVMLLADVVQLVATPVYAAEGCDGANYSSVIVVRADDAVADLSGLRGRRAAVNAPHSQSGYNALRHQLAPLAGGKTFFSEVVETGGHHKSMAAVADGQADVTAIDCVTFALTACYRPEATAGLRVLQYTAPAPGLPYVAPAGASPDLVRRLSTGLQEACAEPALAEVREALMLKGVEALPRSAYDCIPAMEEMAKALNYPCIT